MPQLDISTYTSQIFWLVITFGALFLLMWRVVAPRVGDVLESRQKRIEDNLNKAAEFRKEAETAIEAYEQALADARAEAQAVIAAANAELAAETSKREAELTDRLSERIADSEAEIAKAVADAVEGLGEAAKEVAAAAAERLAGETLDEGDVSKAVDAALKARG